MNNQQPPSYRNKFSIILYHLGSILVLCGKKLLELSEIDYGTLIPEMPNPRPTMQDLQSIMTVYHNKIKQSLHRRSKSRLFMNTQESETILDVCKKRHCGTEGDQSGSAYGFSWKPYLKGYLLDCGSMIAAHLQPTQNHNENAHGFPDLISKFVPERVAEGDEIEYWHNGLHKATIVGRVLSTGRHGARTIYGTVPCFRSEHHLASGTPIFKEGRLVSVITTSNNQGLYAVSGISGTSGHMKSHAVRIRKATTGQAIYGGIIADYDTIKTEAMRVKQTSAGFLHYELVVFPDRMDIVSWRGDNFEEFHARCPVKLEQ